LPSSGSINLRPSKVCQADKATYDWTIQTATAASTTPNIVFGFRVLSGGLKYPVILSPINAQIENAIRLLTVNAVVTKETVHTQPVSD
jgi:hypothetical protein